MRDIKLNISITYFNFFTNCKYLRGKLQFNTWKSKKNIYQYWKPIKKKQDEV